MFRQWVDSGEYSDHMPICLEIQRNPKTLASPFKLLSAWIRNEEVLQIIQTHWTPYIVEEGTRATIHFSQILSRIKNLLKDWARNKKIMDDQAITQIEAELKEI